VKRKGFMLWLCKTCAREKNEQFEQMGTINMSAIADWKKLPLSPRTAAAMAEKEAREGAASPPPQQQQQQPTSPKLSKSPQRSKSPVRSKSPTPQPKPQQRKNVSVDTTLLMLDIF
jgi:hypothetical protein